jgi:hypothetical protein
VLFSVIEPYFKPFRYKLVCHYFFILAKYFMYSQLLFSLCFVAMLCYSEVEEIFDKDFF